MGTVFGDDLDGMSGSGVPRAGMKKTLTRAQSRYSSPKE